jgi:hypothetical protein
MPHVLWIILVNSEIAIISRVYHVTITEKFVHHHMNGENFDMKKKFLELLWIRGSSQGQKSKKIFFDPGVTP